MDSGEKGRDETVEEIEHELRSLKLLLVALIDANGGHLRVPRASLERVDPDRDAIGTEALPSGELIIGVRTK